jgi:hypothetical protein
MVWWVGSVREEIIKSTFVSDFAAALVLWMLGVGKTSTDFLP